MDLGFGNGGVNVSLNATGAVIFMTNGNVMFERPSIITGGVRAKRVLSIKRRTFRVLKEAPNAVITSHPVGRKIVTSCSAAITVVGCFVGGTANGTFVGPCIVIYMPDNIARIRGQTILSTAQATKTGRTFVVRRPFTTTINTKLPIRTPANGVIISVKNNAASITAVSLNKVIADHSDATNNSQVSRTVVRFVHGGCNLLVNRQATRGVGVAVNYTSVRGTTSCNSVRVENQSVIGNLPGALRVRTRSVTITVRSIIRGVVLSMERILRRAPPRVSTSIVSRNVILANNNTLLGDVTRIVSTRTRIPMFVTGSPLSYISVKANRALGGVGICGHGGLERWMW